MSSEAEEDEEEEEGEMERDMRRDRKQVSAQNEIALKYRHVKGCLL